MSSMAVRMRRVLVLAKRSAYDMYVARHQDPTFTRLMLEPQVSRGFSFLLLCGTRVFFISRSLARFNVVYNLLPLVDI